MKRLSYQTLEEQGYDGYLLKEAPERMLQFGEGNFMRAFVDYWFDLMNERIGFQGKVVLCQPIGTGLANMINEQEGLYTLFLRGFEDGKRVNEKRVISSVSRCLDPYADYQAVLDCAKNPDLRFISCNTTEAGIVYDPTCEFADKPASSYPGKLTQFLYERFQHFGSEKGKGFVILSCELIDDNGKELEKCVLQYVDQWGLGEDFKNWVKEENIFCSTLVDRIVTGYPRKEAEKICEELSYEDRLLDTGEVFGFWIIEGPERLKEELPFEEAGLPVVICQDHKPYKQRKVRILNGAHTSMVLGAYLAGQDIVRDCMNDEVICGFMNKTIYEEIIPTLTLPEEELMEFAAAVRERFNNPFVDHALLDISLNSTAKWKARVLPSLKEYVKQMGQVPVCIAASLAFYIAFYCGHRMEGNVLIGERAGSEYAIRDDQFVLEFFAEHQSASSETIVKLVLGNRDFWGEDLTQIDELETCVIHMLETLREKGAYEVMKLLQKKYSFKHTDKTDKDFVFLCSKLEDNLEELVGDQFDRGEYQPYNNIAGISDVIIVYQDKTPVACGGFKMYDEEHAELKRIFVDPSCQGMGLGAELLRRLEAQAKIRGYRWCILETSPPLIAACHMYKKAGYKIIPNYGSYADMEDSICMQRKI